MGVRLLNACEMAGLSVPEQVAIICRGNDESLCETAPVPLSAIDMNVPEQARIAIRQLERLVKGAKPPKKEIKVPVKGFVERLSTDILAVPDKRVATAIRFLWDHMDVPLTVEEVAREVGVSRNTLERAFKRCLGRGVSGELRRKRLEKCKELLRSTNLSLEKIGSVIGLKSRRFLHYAFKDAFGMTPNQYRKSKKAGAR
jgi:LacI family transcriptional regulator